VTGVSGSITETATLFLNVVDVPQDYTLSVTTPSPTTVSAGSGAQATITVTPIASYTGSVTLACFSVTPTVVAAPVCTFNPPTVPVTNGIPPTSVLTISTFGTATNTTQLVTPRLFYALGLAIPGLLLAGAGIPRKRRKNLLRLLLLMTIAGAFLFLPACNAASTTADNGLVTPNNTYTFTLSGTDANGVTSSNTNPTVAITVN